MWDYKRNGIPVQAWKSSEDSIKLRFLYFKTISTLKWHGYQPYTPATFIPQKIFLLFISVSSWTVPKGHIEAGRIMLVTSSAIEPATFWPVAQYLNQLRHSVTLTWHKKVRKHRSTYFSSMKSHFLSNCSYNITFYPANFSHKNAVYPANRTLKIAVHPVASLKKVRKKISSVALYERFDKPDTTDVK
jgi:hypothetical protein